ncbi:hypothetical protein [Lactococcus fujiensis]|uniref:hypothetical protein n=1 Tax=Lactococcus fujiensis TaxID=610251 RepID=UPI000A8ECE79|nr:hypothetical protein [Lactococcus fujiensis]
MAEIFHFSEKSFEYDEFVKCLEELLWSIEKGKALYPHFFSAQAITISIGSSAQSLQTNYDYWSHIKESLVKILIIDKKIRPDVFDDNLTAEKFVDYVFELFLHVILSDDKNNGLIKFVQNSIY